MGEATPIKDGPIEDGGPVQSTTPAGNRTTIEATGITKIYQSSGDGVRHLDIRVPRGTIVGLIGPSGCGKTTTVRLLTGLLMPDAGEVRVLGGDPT